MADPWGIAAQSAGTTDPWKTGNPEMDRARHQQSGPQPSNPFGRIATPDLPPRTGDALLEGMKRPGNAMMAAAAEPDNLGTGHYANTILNTLLAGRTDAQHESDRDAVKSRLGIRGAIDALPAGFLRGTADTGVDMALDPFTLAGGSGALEKGANALGRTAYVGAAKGMAHANPISRMAAGVHDFVTPGGAEMGQLKRTLAASDGRKGLDKYVTVRSVLKGAANAGVDPQTALERAGIGFEFPGAPKGPSVRGPAVVGTGHPEEQPLPGLFDAPGRVSTPSVGPVRSNPRMTLEHPQPPNIGNTRATEKPTTFGNQWTPEQIQAILAQDKAAQAHHLAQGLEGVRAEPVGIDPNQTSMFGAPQAERVRPQPSLRPKTIEGIGNAPVHEPSLLHQQERVITPDAPVSTLRGGALDPRIIEAIKPREAFTGGGRAGDVGRGISKGTKALTKGATDLMFATPQLPLMEGHGSNVLQTALLSDPATAIGSLARFAASGEAIPVSGIRKAVQKLPGVRDLKAAQDASIARADASGANTVHPEDFGSGGWLSKIPGVGMAARESNRGLQGWDAAVKGSLSDKFTKDFLAQGYTPKVAKAKAADRVAQDVVDYSDTSDLTKAAKHALPFATYATKKPGIIARAVARHPERVLAMTRNNPNFQADRDEPMTYPDQGRPLSSEFNAANNKSPGGADNAPFPGAQAIRAAAGAPINDLLGAAGAHYFTHGDPGKHGDGDPRMGWLKLLLSQTVGNAPFVGNNPIPGHQNDTLLNATGLNYFGGK